MKGQKPPGVSWVRSPLKSLGSPLSAPYQLEGRKKAQVLRPPTWTGLAGIGFQEWHRDLGGEPRGAVRVPCQRPASTPSCVLIFFLF